MIKFTNKETQTVMYIEKGESSYYKVTFVGIGDNETQESFTMSQEQLQDELAYFLSD